MARTKTPHLTDAEVRLMDIVWDRRRATVADVAAALAPETGLAYSTVLTTMRILEEKGYLRHTKEGRAFVYEPVVERTEASRGALRYIISRFFGNSPEQLVLNMLEDEEMTPEELARLKERIDAAGVR